MDGSQNIWLGSFRRIVASVRPTVRYRTCDDLPPGRPVCIQARPLLVEDKTVSDKTHWIPNDYVIDTTPLLAVESTLSTGV